MKIKLVFSIFVLFLSACASQPVLTPISANSGVRGQAVIGPMCPVMRVEDPCPDEPYQASLTVLSLDGQEVMRFTTDAEGKFEIQLPPGDYVLRSDVPAGKPVIPSAADVPFTVLPNQFTDVIVSFDSGIR
jgi:hypothetical protein